MSANLFSFSFVRRTSVAVAVSLITAISASAVTVIADNFDSGVASPAWDVNANTANIVGGALGSTNALNLNAAANNPGLGESFGSATGGLGADDFLIDFYFNVQATASRQFSLNISSGSVTPNINGASVNLRIQNGNFEAFTTAWNDIPGLSLVTAGQWYHAQVEGIDFGSPTASYTVRLSDAGGSAFTSAATGVTFVQSTGTPITTARAQSFIFNTAFGSNPGYRLDEVMVTTVPEPSSLLCGGLALLTLVRRRR